MVILLDTKNNIKGVHTVFIGTIDSCVAHPRDIFKLAIKYSAKNIIVSHNHPSGNTNPSKEDITVTERLVDAGKIIGISLLDHVVIGSGTSKYVSLKEAGYIK